MADTEAVIIDAGTLEFNEEEQTATGLLIPFGVPARSNLGTFTFSAGDVVLPADVTGMSLNVEHKREDVVGGFTKVWEQPEGVMATFAYAKTDAGRQAFADGKSGKRKNLSAEVAKVRIQNGKALPGSILFAAAQVEKPAFEGATLLAAEDTTEPVGEIPQDEDIDAKVKRLVAEAIANLPTAEALVSEVIEPPAAPAEEPTANKEKETLMANENNAGDVQIPATLLAGHSGPATVKAEDVDLGTVFASMNAVKNGIAGQSEDAATLLAALADIKYNANGGLTTAASGVLQPAWVGRLWQGKRYVRKYIDLVNHLYGGIALGGRKGFTIDQGTALVAEWGGNKTELPTGTASTSTKASTLFKYGFAVDVAREWYDLEGGADVLQAFTEGVVDSYAKITDLRALTEIFNAAAGNSLAKLEAPDTFPSVAGHDYPEAMGMLIQGIDLIEDADDTPSFAIVNRAARRQMRYTPKDLVPEFVTFTVAPEGQGTADGKVKVVTAPDSAFVGLNPAEPAVIVGAKNSIELREQGQTPIQLDALDIARGGIDKAWIGYLESFTVRPEGVVLIGTEAV